MFLQSVKFIEKVKELFKKGAKNEEDVESKEKWIAEILVNVV